MTKQWIDFAALKAQTGFLPVLAHYGIDKPKRSTGSVKVRCVFHDDTKPSLSVDLTEGAGKFQCHSCQTKGNIIEFIKEKDDCSLREAAIKLAEICDIDVPYKNGPAKAQKHRENGDNSKTTNEPSGSKKRRDEASVEPQDDSKHEDGPINPPLSFALTLDATHPYVGQRLTDMNLGDESMSRAEIVETFGLGVGSRGMMKDRLAIPIHNEQSELVAYAGRWALDEDDLPEDEEKYKLPPRFRMSHTLFNLHRAMAMKEDDPESDWVVITEGYFGAIRLHALGVPAVSVMGTSISDEQINLLDAELNPSRVIVLFDGDEPGKKAAKELVVPMLAKQFFVHNATALLEDDEQPDEMTDDRIMSFERLRSLVT